MTKQPNEIAGQSPGGQIPQGELDGILFDHKTWVNSKGDKGQAAILANKNLEGMDLSRANLQDANLEGTNLQNAFLAHADLRGANLTKANLNSADLTSVKLDFSDLRGASMVAANMTMSTIQRANMEEVQLENANLEQADLSFTILSNSKMKNSRMHETVLRNTQMLGANLEDADLQKADLRMANLEGANFKNSKLNFAKLFRARLSNAELGGSELIEADLQEAFLNKAFLAKANLTKATLIEAVLDDADLSRAMLEEANLDKASFRKANLTYAKLRKATIADTHFGMAVLTGASMPAVLKDFKDSLSNVAEVSQNAKTIYFWMLGMCAFSLLTNATNTNEQSMTVDFELPLPVLGSKVPGLLFFTVAPFLTLGVFSYLHIYLFHLWDLVTGLPAYFSDGLPLKRKIYPWMINLIVENWRSTSENQKNTKSFFRYENFRKGVIVFLVWGLAPLTMMTFAGRFWFLGSQELGYVFVVLSIFSIMGSTLVYDRSKEIIRKSEVI